MTADAIMRHNAFRREKAIFPRVPKWINFSGMTCGGDEHTIIIPAPVSTSIGGRVGGVYLL